MKHHSGPLTPDEEADLERPSQSHSPRFGFDVSIRSKGYRIMSRPKHGEPTWERSGITFTHSEVLRREKLEPKSTTGEWFEPPPE